MISIPNDEVILDEATRKLAIEYFISDDESKCRVNEAIRRHNVYNDKTSDEVIKKLAEEVSKESLAQMANRAANISVGRKVVDKLAQSYVGGVKRTAQDPQDQKAVDDLSRAMVLDTKLKKLDRSFELQKNSLFMVLPYKSIENGESDESAKYILKASCYEPYRYHLISDSQDEEQARVVVIEDSRSYVDKEINGIPSTADGHNTEGFKMEYHGSKANSKNESQFIWWSSKYHFTTDVHGKIIQGKSPEDGLNPINKIPGFLVAENQDGHAWGKGGQDLIDGAILINLLITDMFCIANVQGWGQLVLIGKNIPKEIQVGPHKAIRLETQDGDTPPSVTYETANAPLDQWMSMVEQYTALVLSTNHLSPSTVSAKLDARSPASGISMLIEQAESTLDLEDRQKIYQDKEREMWEIIRRWQEVYNGSFAAPFNEIPVLKSSDVSVRFMRTKPVITEDQKLQNIKLRQELGINTLVEIIKLDDPDLTDEEAEEKLLKITAEKIKNTREAMTNASQFNEEVATDEKDEDEEEEEKGIPVKEDGN